MSKNLPELELLTERFAKLLLGEDMSGGKKGVSSALALSNAITNLSASIFGELWRLEPLPADRMAKWTREIGWFLSVVNHIVEFVPSYQSTADGSIVEVMVTKTRSDIQMNIPALKKLEAMLLECLDKFTNAEFWYEEREKDPDCDDKSKRDKWWLPTPRVPEGGLTEDTRKKLHSQRDSVSQILKAAMAINSQVLAEMEIPDVYWESFPKNGKAILGETLHRHITSESFCPDVLLCSLDLSSDHSILDVKNRIEAAYALWKKKIQTKDQHRRSSAWGHFGMEDKRELYAERAETILMLLKLRFPGLPQSFLDISKIQYNKDVGQSVLESYSRVLESLAFNVLSRINEVIRADDLNRRSLRSSGSISLSRGSLSETDSFCNNTSFLPSPVSHCVYPTPSHVHSLSIPTPSPTDFRMKCTIEDTNYFMPSTTPSTSPSGSPTSLASPLQKQGDNNHNDDNDIDNKNGNTNKTLSDFIGWQIPKLPKDGPIAPKTPDAGVNQKNLASSLSKKDGKHHRWSYIDNLDKMGSVHSPPSRD